MNLKYFIRLLEQFYTTDHVYIVTNSILIAYLPKNCGKPENKQFLLARSQWKLEIVE